MAYDPNRHHRRSIRLRGYDYTQAGAYFVTICTQGRACLLGHVQGAAVGLTDAGRMAQRTWDELPAHYPGVAVDAFVVMPNHIHGIVVIEPPAVGAGPRAGPPPGPRAGAPGPEQGPPHVLSLPDVVHRFKTMTTRRYADGVRRSGWPPFHGRLWQRNYHERVLRDEAALNRVRRYVAENPTRWAFDRENPEAYDPVRAP